MTEIQKECNGKFIQARMNERHCPTCNSLAVCMSQTQMNVNKRYFSLNQLNDNLLKTAIKQGKERFFEFYKNASSQRTISEMWKILQRICIINEKPPKEIQLKEFIEYLEMLNDSVTTTVIISYIRRITKEFYRFEHWNTIQTVRRTKITSQKIEINPDFYESDLYINYKEWFTIYSDRLSDKKNKRDTNKCFINFLHYAWENGIKTTEDKKELLRLCQKHIAIRGFAPSTKKKHRALYKQYFESNLDMWDFSVKFKPYQSKKHKLKSLPTETNARLLYQYAKMDMNNQWFYPLFSTVVYTGLRISEVTAIKINNVDLEHRFFRIYDSKTGDKDQQIVIHLYEIIKHNIDYIKNKNPEQEYLFIMNSNDRPIRTQHIRDHLQNISAKLGIPYYTPHKYRDRIANTIYEKSGWNMSYVQDFLNHRSIKSTETYLLQFRRELMRKDYAEFIPNITE